MHSNMVEHMDTVMEVEEDMAIRTIPITTVFIMMRAVTELYFNYYCDLFIITMDYFFSHPSGKQSSRTFA